MQYNKDFLLQLDKIKNKTIFARVTALTVDELPIETIEGKITGGSINIDGTSAVRRSCSLTLVAQDVNYSDYLWGLNTKFKLEIGLENNINSIYPKIIWFPQGIFIATSLNTSQTTNNFSMSLSGKDKMCRLNGEISGALNATVDFGTYEEIDTEGNVRIIKRLIPDIIRDIVHIYAGEPLHNIIINDLETLGLELLEYRYDTPMYLYRKAPDKNGNGEELNFTNVLLNGKTKCWRYLGDNQVQATRLENIPPSELDMLVDELTGSNNPTKFLFSLDRQPGQSLSDLDYWYIAKIEFGQTAGYRTTDLIYAGDLIGNVGDSLTSILDKIKNMLGEFEYGYDIDGRFIFQKKQSFVNTMWNSVESNQDNGEDIQALALASNYAYTFNEGELISSFSNSPNLTNVKNDFSIWGTRKTVNGVEIPVHLRYAIDCKPIRYCCIEVENDNQELIDYKKKYGISISGQRSMPTDTTLDWREIIYIMAADYMKYNFLSDFEQRVAMANPSNYPSGTTGYEQYYTDIYSFWRELYNPKGNAEDYEMTNMDRLYWNKNVYEHPELLNFWFDFLDVEGELSQFNVRSIGARTKPVNDKDIKSIYFKDTPNIIFDSNLQYTADQIQSGYKYIQVKNIDNMFSISSQGKSAKDRLDELIYNHSYAAESVNITTIPIYYLEPNTRIYLHDSKTQLDGDYIISRISIPLTYNGMMSITATKAAQTLI